MLSAIAEKKMQRALVSGRELFVCDHFIDPATVTAVGEYVKTLPYARSETSLAGMAPTASSAEVPDTPLMADFMARLGCIAEEMFAGERFRPQRAYINHSLYGDAYQMHRDLSAVTVLYYANLFWEADWGGETIYFDDNNDAQLVVSPRPGRMVVSRGAILHRGTVPTRDCKQARLTIAYKLRKRGDLSGF
ncbi:MAG TPA: 2OG-Fe(II) oxygenase [Rhizomicrobium sp.]|nr:2OG-Fe(II) oxygenase [Rhizomicrobium sp.]